MLEPGWEFCNKKCSAERLRNGLWLREVYICTRLEGWAVCVCQGAEVMRVLL